MLVLVVAVAEWSGVEWSGLERSGVEWSGSSTRLFSVDSLCDPVRLSATALRILELEKVASAQTSVH